jgi:hypothetical protein
LTRIYKIFKKYKVDRFLSSSGVGQMHIGSLMVNWFGCFFGNWVCTDRVQWVTQRVCARQGLELLCKQVQYKKKCTGEERWLPDLCNMLVQKSIVQHAERNKLYGDWPLSDNQLASLHPRHFLDVIKGIGTCDKHEHCA